MEIMWLVGGQSANACYIFKNFFAEAEIKKFSMTSGTEEVQKGEATKQQLGMYNRYM